MARWLGTLHQGELNLFATVHVRWARQWLDRTMRFVTELAGPVPSVALCLLFLANANVRSPLGWRLLVATGGSHLLVQVLKRVIQRDRPYLVIEGSRGIVAPLADHSFPSGHTTAAVSMAVVLSAAQPLLTPLLGALAALVGFSRTYLGHHYPTDVLAGALIGILFGIWSVALIA
ncbi:phosphatase PAP2 family protein [Limnochorda pilosa]|uniref:Phosphatidic acid phosphatase type 2/haloperoxidase domain-containing protein n=1 Tax=Limnochorda pilosa TaxID=1555112 RepID=A0A0K2SFN9_LIMPI|nr:phosphatase PAP2 family protein [Limnochorda pilosa]BAS25923.1 hypothetical protein LIP_0066 [Limnochorda pilosa]